MQQYLTLLRQCFEEGTRQKNRTGIDTFMIPGGMMQFNLEDGFPILTTKKVAFAQVVGELLGFINAFDNAADFRKLGCKIWDANANDNAQWVNNPHRRGPDDLGRIYGQQWRKWHAMAPNGDLLVIDQLGRAVEAIMMDPQSRRILVSAWQPGELERMALPPCHIAFQFIVQQDGGLLHLCMVMRSCDMFLGIPFNISSYALLLHLIAGATGLTPGRLTMNLWDVHIYENHVEQVKEQLTREPRNLPLLRVESPNHAGQTPRDALRWLENLMPNRVSLLGYTPHPPIKAEMAV